MYTTVLPSGASGGVTKYASFALLPAVANNGDVAVTTDTDTFYIYNGVTWIPIASPSTAFGRAGRLSLGNGVSTAVVTFSSTLGTTNYAIQGSIKNTADSSPIFLQIVDTVKAATGFTATFNAPTDSTNYVFEWFCVQDI